MAFCNNCGAELQDGVKFCGECGARVDSEATDPVRLATVSPAEEQPEIPQPAQPVWAQFAGQTQGQTVPPTFFVPKRRLGKGGGVAMIIIGSVMITYFLFFAVAVIAQAIDSRSGIEDLAPVFILLVLTLLAGGLLLLLFGIRKIKNVNRYNANL